MPAPTGAPAPRDRAAAMPVPGRDYPRTLAEFHEFFPDEGACERYLERLSWPDGFVCPRCGPVGREPWRGSRRRLVCPACGHQTTVTSGTVFQGTRTPLRCWLAAAWMIATAEQGVAAADLRRRLGLGSYETAWMLLHRYRRAMVRSGRPRLVGLAEVGATTIGRHSVVAIAVEDRGAEPGRVRMQQVALAGPRELAEFTAWAVEPGTVVRTAGADAGALLLARGYLMPPAGPGAAHASVGDPFAYAELVTRLLRRWLGGTHQGAARPEQLGWYLDEFTFRFNRRWSTHRGLLFHRLLEEAVVTPPVTYADTVAQGPWSEGDR